MQADRNPNEIAAVTGALSVMFSVLGKEKGPAVLQAYLEDLSDIPTDTLLAGIRRTRQNGSAWATPADIRKNCGASGGKADAQKAWAVAVKTASSAGARSWVKFENKCIAVAVKESAGTWSNFCRQPTEQLERWTKQAFVAAYERAVGQGVSEEIVLAGEGTDERPVLVEESGKALRLALEPAPEVKALPEATSEDWTPEQREAATRNIATMLTALRQGL